MDMINEFSMEQGLSNEKVIVIDFGGQYNQLVARRVLSLIHI